MAIELPASLTTLWSRLPMSSLTDGENRSLSGLILTGVVIVFATSKFFKLLHGLKVVNYMPGFRAPIYPYSLLGVTLPTTWWNPGYYFLWRWRHNIYKRFGAESFSFVPWLSGTPAIFTSNLDVTRQVASGAHKTDFLKPESASLALLYWGMNLVASDGDTWRKHRRVVGPAFSNDLYQMVWKKTAETYHQMVEVEGWTDKKTVEIESVQKYTFKLALLIIGSCGFGFQFDWTEPPVSPDGTMSLQAALRIINNRHLVPVFCPNWLLKSPIKYFREVDEAVTQMKSFMHAQVAERRERIHSAGAGDQLENDAFTMMVKSNEDEGSKLRLSDEELIGNVFVLLFAGHETTAHTFAATLANLAVHPEIQEEVLEQILSVVGWDRAPEFADYAKFDKVLAAFYEALRLFPSGHIMFREAKVDTTLQIPNPPGEEGSKTIPVPKGTTVIVDMVGVQYNPRYFDEPEKYKPSRWYGISNESEAFSAFSIGPRACLGRKFATTEAVSFLTLLLRDWKVEPLLREGETVEKWKERTLDGHLLITLGVKSVPIRFVRRERP